MPISKINTICQNNEETITSIKNNTRRRRKIEKTPEIEQINKEITETILKIMHHKTIRHSEEHMNLRKKLHELCQKRNELGYKRNNNKLLLQETMHSARKIREKKKK